MSSKKPFRLGVVEGFFGQVWSWEARTAYAEFLARCGFCSYLYAPKNDDYLRKQWDKPFPDQHLKRLQTLSKHYEQHNIDFGIGLSPFELYKNFDTTQKNKLKQKLQAINSINPNTLCILFDDMPGSTSDLAQQQVAIMDFVCEHSSAAHFIMCPTYYSDDPLLEKHFGEAPSHYLEDLGQALNPSIEIFWTGPKVVSKQLPSEHLKHVAEKLNRKPLIWDNYPVNDSQVMCEFLHLQAFKHRNISLQETASGHMANPMNQAFLSQLALHSLSRIYQNAKQDHAALFEEACSELCSKELAELFLQDGDIFQRRGLSNISEEENQTLAQRYAPFKSNPMVKELIAWLNKHYEFDPSCLT